MQRARGITRLFRLIQYLGEGFVEQQLQLLQAVPCMCVQLGAGEASNGQIRWEQEGLCHILFIGLVYQNIK